MKKYLKIIRIILVCIPLTACQISRTEDTAVKAVSDEQDNSAEVISLVNEDAFDYYQIPLYAGEPYTEVNQNQPYQLTDSKYEYIRVSELDELGRCGDVEAVLGPDTLPEVQRGSIGTVRPSGWQTVRYDDLIDGNYLYNRCHLIAYEISGINADEEILITGTRYLNIEGMLPFENKIAAYIKDTGNHVYYHASPVFVDDELVCRGVLIEAASIEDGDLQFCVFCYNVQPGITINYQNGESQREEQLITRTVPSQEQEYVLNISTGKFHYPECDSVRTMKDKNKRFFFCSRETLIEEGYEPCAVCNP